MPDTSSAVPAGARVLLISSHLACVRAQLRGQPVDRATALPLRDDVSTDEITPAADLSTYDERLGAIAHTGLTIEGVQVLPRGALAAARFDVLVAGRRYGKGSSREHSPAAEKAAGVRLVIAESFERIYRQNADNIGLLTSTDLRLIDRLSRGEAIPLEDVLAGRDALAAAILRAGGLLRYGRAHLSAGTAPHTPDAVDPASHRVGPSLTAQPHPALTLFEKILQRRAFATPATPAWGPPGTGVFARPDWRFIHEYYTAMAEHQMQMHLGGVAALHEPRSIVVFEDHSAYLEESPAHQAHGRLAAMHALRGAQRAFAQRHGLREYRTLTDAEADDAAARGQPPAAAGISHAMMIERHALPGELVVGTDSHTPHSGALGCAAIGVGTTDMACAFVTGAVRCVVPTCIRVQLSGGLAAGVTAKDVVLHLLALPLIRSGGGLGRVFEFCGEAVDAMSVDERATLTNMTAELGGLSGIVAPDARTVAYLRERRGIDFTIEPWMVSDAGARYEHEIALDVGTISPMLARPGDPGQGLPIQALAERLRIDIAYGGSCTAGKREDFAHYHAVLAWGLARGLRVPPHVTLYLQYGTTDVRDWCVGQGWDEVFRAAGARILQPSCGACANCGPGSSAHANQVTVSAINRNFPGRSGPGQVWLASPPTVMASALAGHLIDFAGLEKSVESADGEMAQ